MFNNKLFAYLELIKFYIFYFKIKVLKLKCYMTPEEFIALSDYDEQIKNGVYDGYVNLKNHGKEIILFIDKPIDNKYIYRNAIWFNVIDSKDISFTIVSTLETSHCVRFGCNFKKLNSKNIKTKNDKIVLISKDPSVIYMYSDNLKCLFVTKPSNEIYSSILDYSKKSINITNVQENEGEHGEDVIRYSIRDKKLFDKFLNLLDKF